MLAAGGFAVARSVFPGAEPPDPHVWRLTFADVRLTFADVRLTFADRRLTFADRRLTFAGGRSAAG